MDSSAKDGGSARGRPPSVSQSDEHPQPHPEYQRGAFPERQPLLAAEFDSLACHLQRCDLIQVKLVQFGAQAQRDRQTEGMFQRPRQFQRLADPFQCLLGVAEGPECPGGITQAGYARRPACSQQATAS
jgi:hypothetical protein